MPQKSVDTEEAAAEKLRLKRRTAIIEELEEKWEAENGPMERPMTQAELRDVESWEDVNGRKWNGRTTKMTEAANEFFFDHKGMGKNSVPSQAEKILRERFPEYSKTTKEKQVSDTRSEGEDSASDTEKSEQTQVPENSAAERLSSIFEHAGIRSKVIEIEKGVEFPSAIVLDKQEIQKEKMVRVYRGIGKLDASVLQQIPYAMRTVDEAGTLSTLEHVRQEVETLAKQPTYENLIAYVNKVRPSLSPAEVARFEHDLDGIEDGILKGNSTRKELVFRQIGHNGGFGDSGITPYISISFDPYEAIGYGEGGLLVIDVPLSKIEDFRADAKEASIKGTIDPKYITAILPRKRMKVTEKKDSAQQLYNALRKVYEAAPADLFYGDALQSERERKLAEEQIVDREQWQKDVEAVKLRRATKLREKFPEVTATSGSEAEEGADVYRKTQTDIFDYHKNRLHKTGRRGRAIDDYEYQESNGGTLKKFTREKIDDRMLLKLRELVVALEQREEKRKEI